MTLNSMVLPSNGVVSLTGRISTSDPGRKARMPLAMTVSPPLTLPLIMPVTSSPVSRAFSRSIQAARRLALSRDRRVSPKPSSRASIATLTKSPTLASTSPASLRNSSTGMKLSDLSPALTTTKFMSTRTTSAVITSPMRISWRVRLSSNRAAKLFSLEATAGERLDIGFIYLISPPLRAGLIKHKAGSNQRSEPATLAALCRYQSSTWRTISSMRRPVLSSSRASTAICRGAALLALSR